MEIIGRNQAVGNQVNLITTDRMHFNEKGMTPSQKDVPTDPFSKILFDSIDQVNSLQQNSDDLEQKMITNPESVNIDDVMIASEKTRLSVSFFKSISEKAIRAYNDIMMIR